MGCWGMGITQSDEYGEVYDRFMREYDEGKPVADITADILDSYFSEFDANDGILHDVYFALGKSQWMCGGVSEEILEKVNIIIQSGVNLSFYKELGATEQDLKVRKRNLDKFLTSLQIPRGTVRHRKKPESSYVAKPKPFYPPLPNLSVGDLLAYPIGDQYRLFLILGYPKKFVVNGTTANCFVWQKKFDYIPDADTLMNERGVPFGMVPGDAFPDDFQVVGKMINDVPYQIWYLVSNRFRMWEQYCTVPVKREAFYRDVPHMLCLPLQSAFDRLANIKQGFPNKK